MDSSWARSTPTASTRAMAPPLVGATASAVATLPVPATPPISPGCWGEVGEVEVGTTTTTTTPRSTTRKTTPVTTTLAPQPYRSPDTRDITRRNLKLSWTVNQVPRQHPHGGGSPMILMASETRDHSVETFTVVSLPTTPTENHPLPRRGSLLHDASLHQEILPQVEITLHQEICLIEEALLEWRHFQRFHRD